MLQPALPNTSTEVVQQPDRVRLQITAEDPQARPGLPPMPAQPMIGILVNGTRQLDGLNCFNCRFHDVTLTYAGGQFRCIDCWFDGTVSIQFSGAAANALALNGWVKQLRDPKQSEPTMLPASQFLQDASAEALKVTLVSPGASP